MYKSDTYLCERSYPLDEIQRDILVSLYLPLIGMKAYSLYMLMYTEAKRMDRFHRPCSLSRLTLLGQCTIEEFEVMTHQLEGIGLLDTYLKDTQYLFQIHSPLTLRQFFHNPILSTLLRSTIGEEEFEITRQHFRISTENTKNYTDITKSFSDIYTVDLSQTKPLRINDSYYHNNEVDIVTDYDFTLFYESLKDYGIPVKAIKSEETYLAQLATVYSVDQLALADIVKDSYQDKKLDKEILSKKIRDYHYIDSSSNLENVHHEQPLAYKVELGNDTLSQHLHYLQSVSPYQLLKNKQGGHTPAYHDLSIAETLMTQIGLTPGVTNVLLEMALGRNDNKLNRNYCETIGASWARKHIHTVKEAYEETQKRKTTRKKKTVKKDVKKQTQEPEVSDEEFLKMLSRLED